MNMKTAVAAVCLVLLCSAVIICISDDSDADASSMDTITVRNGQELADAIRSTYMMNGDTPVPFPKNIVVPSDVSVITIDDSLIGLGEYVDCTSRYFFGTLDGNGCILRADLTSEAFLIETICGQSAIKNFHIEVENAGFGLVLWADVVGSIETDVLLENLILDKYVTCGNNSSAFMSQTYGSKVTFRNCVNNADYIIESYAGVFLGGYSGENNISLTFDGCVNNGNITGNHIFMFIGNDCSKGGKITVENCINSGTFKGIKAAPFSTHSSNGKYTDLNNQCKTLGGFEQTSLTETLTFDANTGKLTIDSSDPKRTYEITMTAYATSENGSTYGMVASMEYEADSTYAGKFVDVYTAAEKYGLDVSPSDFPPGEKFPYKMMKDGNGKVFYVFYFGEGTYKWNMDANPSAYVKVYEDGSFTGMIVRDGALSLKRYSSNYTTFTVDVPKSECYTVELQTPKGNVVKNGDEMSFTVTPALGFEIRNVYMKIGDKLAEISPNNGTYTYTVTSNVKIVVNYEQIYNTVTRILSNVTIDNTQDVIMPGSSFKAKLTPADGYELGTIYVIHGSETYTVSGNMVFIPEVNGNVMISCIGIPSVHTPGEPDEDDDLVIPVQPVQPKNSENNTTTIVACAAAAVAAAMIVAFLLIDGRKP